LNTEVTLVSPATTRKPYNVKIVSRISRGAAGIGNLTDPQRQPSDSIEADLIERAKHGDALAFQALYDKHKRRVYSLCLRMTSNTAEAEDLTQEAFLQLFRKIATFRGESAFSTWLRLQKAVDDLPPGYRTIFVLHDVEGYEHNEIATIVGCSIGNSKSQLHKARMKLRDMLKIKRIEKAEKS
jgi:RNA polymerase sigma-70 factor (ECF subfamily)